MYGPSFPSSHPTPCVRAPIPVCRLLLSTGQHLKVFILIVLARLRVPVRSWKREKQSHGHRPGEINQSKGFQPSGRTACEILLPASPPVGALGCLTRTPGPPSSHQCPEAPVVPEMAVLPLFGTLALLFSLPGASMAIWSPPALNPAVPSNPHVSSGKSLPLSNFSSSAYEMRSSDQ